MNYNFYAGKNDKLDVLEFIFKKTDLHVYDLGSAYSKEISEYKTAEEVASKFDLTNGDKFAITFQLWSPKHEGKPIFRRIELDPTRCNGHSFRYSTEGWGMIQLYFGGIKNQSLNQSHIGHFNEKGALKNEFPNHFNGKVNQWNWKEISKTSRMLKYQIHNRLAIDKIGSVGIMKEANEMRINKIEFI